MSYEDSQTHRIDSCKQKEYVMMKWYITNAQKEEEEENPAIDLLLSHLYSARFFLVRSYFYTKNIQ